MHRADQIRHAIIEASKDGRLPPGGQTVIANRFGVSRQWVSQVSKSVNVESGHVRTPPPQTLEEGLERFYSHFTIGNPDECWEWRGPMHSAGYGSSNEIVGSRVASRASYLLHVGPIPDGMQVCHTCDNRACVNWFHLYAGTASTNGYDRWERNPLLPRHEYPLDSEAWVRLAENTPMEASRVRARSRQSRSDRCRRAPS